MVARNEDGREEGKETREHHGDLRESRINSKEIRFYIENNYGKDLSLNDLSELFHFNSIYINSCLLYTSQPTDCSDTWIITGWSMRRWISLHMTAILSSG